MERIRVSREGWREGGSWRRGQGEGWEKGLEAGSGGKIGRGREGLKKSKRGKRG